MVDAGRARRRPGPVVEALVAGVVAVLVVGVVDVEAVVDLVRGDLPGRGSDPPLQAYLISWSAHAVRDGDAALWDLNAFHPVDGDLAFSDPLLGYLPAGLLGGGSDDAITRYTLLWLLAHAACLAGAYVLARQLGCSRTASVLAALAFGLAPWRLAQVRHLNVWGLGAVPLAAALLLRGHRGLLRPGVPLRARRAGWALLGWAVLTWQALTSVAVTLLVGYAAAGAALVVAVAAVGRAVRDGPAGRRARLRAARPALLADAAGAAVLGTVLLLLLRRYAAVVEQFPDATRDLAEAARQSPGLLGFVAPSENALLLGALQEPLIGPTGGLSTERAVALGVATVLLAVVGLVRSSWPLRRRLVLGAGVLLALWVATGTTYPASAFVWLHANAPGWESSRTPSRAVLVAGLLLAVLAAAGADVVRARLRPRAAAVVLGLLGAVMVVEGLADLPEDDGDPNHVVVDLEGLAAPVLVGTTSPYSDGTAMLSTVDADFVPLVNGWSGYLPARVWTAHDLLDAFPDPPAAEGLRDLGVATLVLLPEVRGETPAATTWTVRAAGHPARLRADGTVVVDLRQGADRAAGAAAPTPAGGPVAARPATG